MESWNVYPQNAPSTPNSTWLCPQNNTPGAEWLHSQNNSNERERNENTAALATPTRYIMEYNDVNQNTSSGSFYNPYEMERLFENNFLKIGNPEDLLNNDIYNNENLSWLNSNENIIPVTTTTSSNIITTSAPSSTVNVTNSPTPSLITDDDQDQLYNNNNNNLHQEEQIIQNPVSTTASFIQYTTNTSPTKSSSKSSSISPRVVKENHYPITTTTTATFYQPNLQQQDHYLQSKKHDPKQLLLPLTTSTNSIDGTMAVSMSSPTSSLFTDDDLDQCDQTKMKGRRQSYYQDFPLSVSTNDLPMQQPSPASSEFSSGEKTPPLNNETISKQKKRRGSQRKLNNRRNSKVEGSLISPIDEPYSESNGKISASISDDVSDIDMEESSPTTSKDTSIDSSISDSNNKRDSPDDGHDETPEEKRARLLERNRIAAAKCRQKKKQAQESLQQQASDLTQKNTTMHSLVNDLREEALKLKNQLLAHSTCNCNVIQEYVRTSGQFAFARPPYTK
ncbi:unnamed protein product [Rhizophagus irregularis]|uniref:BZIP domain-containing protein n=1 Tax=Rhizophagus irregularis TaxID=588596 RepID=A0A2I1GJG1_9GLOM|nr:hypothetical protein RhiirA4_402795 [Rhizophagus irregularis]CAB4422839.1 unnamed protein product [Rhizophagus irregularis]